MSQNYTKAPLSYEGQIHILKSRGLAITDDAKACEWLHNVSYFRFANYLRPLEVDKTLHSFKPGATFDNAVALYNFDKSLRVLIFKAIQVIEVALRTKVIHEFSIAHGAFWFMDNSIARDPGMFANNLSYVRKEVARSKEDFIIEHNRKYTSPDLPPAWKTFEVISFGTLSKLFENLKDNTVKKKVAREFNLPQHLVLESWIRAITVLRNCVAHHSRLWNRKFPVKPMWHKKLRSAWVQESSFVPEKLFAQLCCLLYLLNEIDSNNSFKREIKTLITQYPIVDVAAMGFPRDWEKESLWK